MCLTEILEYLCGDTETLLHGSYEATYDEDGDAFEEMAERTVHIGQVCGACRAENDEMGREGVWIL
jgi:DNA-binding ferritin-like protein